MGCVPSLMHQINLWDSKALRELQSPLYFLGTLLYESDWRKRTETENKAGHLRVPTDCELSWCYSQATFEEGIEERVFGQRAVWSKGRQSHTGQDETRVIICFFTLSVPWRFYPWEQVHGDIQRHWWCPWHLMLLVITSLRTHPWIQSIFSLVKAPGSPFLGRLTYLIAANSQLKHGMRSWWLTCRPSSKHGRKDGRGSVAI